MQAGTDVRCRSEPSSSVRPWLAVTCIAIAFGAAFRLAQFFSRQSFRGDEVSLLMNIVGKPTRELFRAHLEHGQAAPPVFLAVQRWLALYVGTDELTQRLVPLVLSLISLPLMAAVAWRVLTPLAATVATGLFCFSDKCIWFAAEVKQYSGDVACTLALMLLFLLSATEGASPVATAAFLLLGAAGIWFSHAVILVFGGLSAALFLLRCRRGSRAGLIYAIGNLPFVASFLLLYVVSIRHQSADAYLQDWWADSYVDWSHPLGIPLWLVGRLRNLTSYPISPFEWLGALLVPLMFLGLWRWSRLRKWDALGLCLAPVATTLLAAAAHKYPFSGSRVNLFLAPGLLLLAGGGIDWIADAVSTAHANRRIVPTLAAVLLVVPFAGDVKCLFLPRNKGNMGPLVAYLKEHRDSAEPIYVVRNGIEFQWYWPDAPGPVFLSQPVPGRPPPRFWMVTSFNADYQKRELRENLARVPGAARQTGRKCVLRGAAAYEFVFDPG